MIQLFCIANWLVIHLNHVLMLVSSAPPTAYSLLWEEPLSISIHATSSSLHAHGHPQSRYNPSCLTFIRWIEHRNSQQSKKTANGWNHILSNLGVRIVNLLHHLLPWQHCHHRPRRAVTRDAIKLQTMNANSSNTKSQMELVSISGQILALR